MKEIRLNSKRIYEGRVLNLRVDEVKCPNDRLAVREVIEHEPAVVVLALEEPDTVNLIKQYRHATGKILLECPAGIMEPGEDPLSAAKRELKEETGITATHWEHLGEAYLTPGFCDEYMYFYLATDLSYGEQSLDEDETVVCEKVTLSEMNALFQKGELIDGKTVLLYHLVMNHLKRTC